MNISAPSPRAVFSKTKIYKRKKTLNNMQPIKPKIKIVSKQSYHPYFSKVQP
jgi:hypothetical protein